VVFLSSDRDPKAFEEYFCADMPWLALDYAQRELKEIISMSLDVQGIPTLIWVNPKTGDMIMNGRETVGMGAAFFPWDAASVAAARSVSQEKRGVEC
jgi:nucleoredoxin